MRNPDSIMSMFTGLLEEDDSNSKPKELTGILLLSEENNTNKKKRSSKKKQTIIRLIAKQKVVDIKKLGAGIVDSAEPINLDFGDGYNIDVADSWIELLSTLLGGLYYKFGDSFFTETSSSGIFNESIRVSKDQQTVTDYSIESGKVEVYKVPNTELFLYLHYPYCRYSIVESIQNCITRLGYTKGVKITLKRIEDDILNPKTTPNPNPRLNSTSSITSKTRVVSLQNLGKSKYTLVKAIEVYGVKLDCKSLHHAGVLLLSYLFSGYDIINLALKNSIPGRIGLTDDSSEYLGSLPTIAVPGSYSTADESNPSNPRHKQLYFYFNNYSKDFEEYFKNLLKDTDIKAESIKLEVETE